jgi:hypothetical protein
MSWQDHTCGLDCPRHCPGVTAAPELITTYTSHTTHSVFDQILNSKNERILRDNTDNRCRRRPGHTYLRRLTDTSLYLQSAKQVASDHIACGAHTRLYTQSNRILSSNSQDNPFATMQSIPDSRSQTFEEIYGPPENFLEIEVSHPTEPQVYRFAPNKS